MSIKTDNTQTLVNALAEIERLRGRVAAFEERVSSLRECHPHDEARWIDSVCELVDESWSTEAWLLRKQVEAVKDCANYFGGRDFVDVRFIIDEHAQRLRQQADELENNNEQEH